MAANVNRPADFGRGYIQSNENMTPMLIPPSEFEKPATFRSRDVPETQRQFQHLQEKADETKHSQSHSKTHVTATPCAHLKNDYADELIRRQAGEISELKLELTRCRQTYEQESADWKKRSLMLDEKHEAEVKTLEKHLARAQDEFSEKLSHKESETLALSERLERAQMLLDKRVMELEQELNSMQQDSDNSRRQLESELRNKSQMVEDQAHQITRLKTYICETDQAHRPALAWKMEKEALDNRLKISQAENQKLNSTLELFDVRFQALNDILSVQEKELGQAKVGSAGIYKQENSLVTRWREKVFSLLVQQKSAEILHKKDINNMNQKIQGLVDQLTVSQSQVQVLQHTLIDRSAQIQLEVNKTQNLQQELEQTNQVAVCLYDLSKQDHNSVKSLLEFFERIKNQTDDLMIILAEKSGILKMLNQRVSFASSRMEFIKTQLIRKSVLFLGVSKDAVQTLPVTLVDQDASRSRDGDSEKLVYQELEKVTTERDSLAVQVRADAEKWSEIFRVAKSQYTAEIESLTRKVESMDFQTQQKSKNCVRLAEEIENLKEDVKEKDNLISHLQAELSRHARGVENVLTDQKLKDEAEWSKKLADLDQKLNNSKREHAKAVVSLRQGENSHKRRLQQEQDLLKTTEGHLTRKIQQLESKLRSVEKERNLMITTLRQEGLLNQLRSDRGRYIQCVDEDNIIIDRNINDNKLTTDNPDDRMFDVTKQMSGESQAENCSTQITSTISNSRPKSPREPVQLVLEDLKFLTAAVFEDDDNDDDDNDNDNNETTKEEDDGHS